MMSSSSSTNDKSLLLDQKQSTVIYSDKNVEITEPPLETYKEVIDTKSQSSEDIKVSLVVTCCPCPLPLKCETTDPCCHCVPFVPFVPKEAQGTNGEDCDCKKDDCDCGCTKNNESEMSYVSTICSLFSCSKKLVVKEETNDIIR